MRLGRHMPTNSKPIRAAETARRIGCDAIQIFASNPTGWRPPADDLVASAAFAETARMLDLDPVVIHAPYLINLGTLDDIIWEKSIALLTWTMQRGAALGARHAVFHTGSHRGAGVDVGITRVAQGVARVLGEVPAGVMLLLENDVGAANSLGGKFEQLAAILALLPEQQERLGICTDTAHLWGAGYDISTKKSTLEMLRNCDEVIGLERLKVIHLNDTKMALGSHRDVHARIGEGIIPSRGLRALLSDKRLAHVAVLLETPIKTDDKDKEDWEHDAGQIAQARSLMQRDLK
jgi:deoxyribonuclease-4